jgi:DNA-binding Lrp family transcriptional regulator/uncharacterized ParB-like nuclease family protein
MATTSSKSRALKALKKFLGLHEKQGTADALHNFEEARTVEQAHESIDRGLSSVPLEQITGSVGRYHDFDAQFKPKGHNSDERLEAITKAMSKGRSLPPIMLYKIKDNYYILDGHHRFAAAKELGHSHIMASIVELLPSKDTVENRLYHERSEFRDRFKLPGALQITELGQFSNLVEQIEEHRQFLAAQAGKPVSDADAAADWYATIYQPLNILIAKSGLVSSFTGRTVDDLYVYISLHQWKYGKSRQYGIGVDKLIPKNMEEFREKMAQHSEQEYPEMRREINAFILINVEGRQEDKIIDKLYDLEAVREVHSVNGAVDIIIRVKLMRDLLSSDAELISQFMATTIRQWNGVVSTQTLLPGLSKVKDR